MPWHVKQGYGKCSGWAVVKDSDGSIAGCHPTKAKALAQMAALYAKEPMMSDEPYRPPRDSLVRAQPDTFELRAAVRDDGSADENAMPTMIGHLAVFDQWTEINSLWEGNFMERIAPGAFAATFNGSGRNARVAFNHGRDPSIGDKVLGPPDVLEEDKIGARYEVPLLDTSYNRDLVPGLKAGLYGSSFRFSVMKEDFDNKPKPSRYNPAGIPERTIREVQLFEFGPVTYPAYAGANAGVRSMTDDYLRARLGITDDMLAKLAAQLAEQSSSDPGAHQSESTRENTSPATPDPIIVPVISHVAKFRSREEFISWLAKF